MVANRPTRSGRALAHEILFPQFVLHLLGLRVPKEGQCLLASCLDQVFSSSGNLARMQLLPS